MMPEIMKAKKFYAGANGLSLFDVERGGDDTLYGFVADNEVDSSSVDSDEMTFATQVQNTGTRTVAFLCPFVGEPITVSADIETLTGGNASIGVAFHDAEMDVLSVSGTTVTATGRASHLAVIPSNTVYIRMYIVKQQDNSDIVTVAFKRPALQIHNTTWRK
jgi:hypothetical protein